MRTSSAAIDLPPEEIAGGGTSERMVGGDYDLLDVSAPVAVADRQTMVSRSTLLSGGYNARVTADSTRIAARMNASAISDEEVEALHHERRELLSKQFAQGISRKEEHRLQYIRWSLDRIEDAKYGADLDLLTDGLLSLRALKEQIDHLQNVVSSHSRKRR